MRKAALIALLLCTALELPAQSQEETYSDELCSKRKECASLMNMEPDYSTIEAEVLEVIDGDSVRLRLHLLPGLEYVVNVRLRGLDTPELRNAGCEQERQLGEEAKAFLERRLELGTWVYLDRVVYDKYGGRVVAEIFRRMSDRVLNLGNELIAENKAVSYEGVGPRTDWCTDEFGEPS